ncbi:hypothetical protein SESBI_35997 [Sesbania bispinosa]|nr:hypothetical protein SESBI_35997 [Sesbania bispinosa]
MRGGVEETEAETGGAANPSDNQGNIISTDSNLHVDWIVVTKPKRDNKLKAKDAKLNGGENVTDKGNQASEQGKKVASISNKFSLLTSTLGADKGTNSPAAKHVAFQSGPSFVCSPGPKKILTRKKRPRKEPAPIQPKIFNFVAVQAKENIVSIEPKLNTRTAVVQPTEKHSREGVSSGPSFQQANGAQLSFSSSPTPFHTLPGDTGHNALESMDDTIVEESEEDNEMVANSFEVGKAT